MFKVDEATVEGLNSQKILALPPTVQATANATETLTVASPTQWIFTGTVAGQIIKLPDATTLIAGWVYYIWNASTQNITIQTNDTSALLTLLPGNAVHLTLRSNGSTNGTWDYKVGHVRGHTIMSTDDHTDVIGTPADGQILVYRTSDGNWHTESGAFLSWGGRFFEERLFTTNNADWAINRTAQSYIDTLNNALKVWRFDDAAEEGVGLTLETPVGAVGIVLATHGRAQTLPVAPVQVALHVYAREVPHNAAITAWSAPAQLASLDIPTNRFFQYNTQSISFAALGLTAGRVTQLQLTRDTADVSDTLFGDWALLELGISFI